jgi:calnexin
MNSFMNSLLMAGLVSSASPDASSSVRSKLIFSETFDDAMNVFESGRWIKSLHEKYEGQPVMVKGLNDASEAMKGNKGLELTQENKFYGVSAPFTFDFQGKDIVVQYEFNAEKLECGGAYVKLPRVGPEVNFQDLDADSPYSIMFGPDKCGPSAKVHFIVQYMNPVTKEWEEKHLVDPPLPLADRKTHLYTLHIKQDSSFEILIDKESVKTGSLLTDMEPPINPPELIDDPTDSKPEDWVEEAQIPDPAEHKPEDWDEDAPLMIPDLEEVMPSDWQPDAPLMIPDPEASRPEDWDDDEDGVWEAPQVPNPACASSGCGSWTQPIKKNPAYKGPWSAPLIDNPLYRGEWKAKQVPNPSYFKHENPVEHLAPIDGVFLEVWTTNNAFHFDNFVFGHSLADALSFAEETFDVKTREEAQHQKDRSKAAVEAARKRKLEEGGFVDMIEVYFAMFTELVIMSDPIVVAMSLVSLFIAVVFLIIKGSSNLTPEAAVGRESGEAVAEEEEQENEEETSSPAVVEEVEEEEEVEVPVATKSKAKPKTSAKTSDDKAGKQSPDKEAATTTKRRSRRTGD